MERANSRIKPGSWSAAHPNEGDDERWKGSPSTESTGEGGTNARVASEHGRSENAPASPGKGRTSRSGRRQTRH